MASPQRTPEAPGVLELWGARRDRRGRICLVLVVAATWLAGGVPAALAAGGGGSSGFGGGGGGGGVGGGYGDGSGSAPSPLWDVIVGLLVAAVLVVVGLVWLRVRGRRGARLRAVEVAAVEAAEDDPAFASERVRSDAARLFAATQAAWDARDAERLGQLVGPDLLVEWTRRLDDFARKGWHNRVAVGPERVKIDYVGLVNRIGDCEDRVVVHVQALIWDYVETNTGRVIPYAGSSAMTRTLSEFWTLGKRDSDWIVLSIEGEGEGKYHLTEPLAAVPSDDTQLLHDEAVAELAADQTPMFAPAEVADLDFAGPARAAALDLALADERFDPDLIEASVRRILAAWASAIDGDDTALEALARPEAVRALLYPGDADRHTRLVVRNPHIRTVRITAIDPATQPPSLSIVIQGSAVRYIEDRATAAVLSGNPDSERHVRLTWTLALEAPPPWPWRLATVATSTQNGSPARHRDRTASAARVRDRERTHH
jgi:predicted lipid-binding transport protein (Tim44 family)